MRALLTSTAVLAIGLVPVQSNAADISAEGARKIEQALTYYLPQDIVDSGFLKVTPGTRRYELSVDLAPLLKDIGKDVFSINGLKPFVHYLTPEDDGQWKVEVNDHLNVNGTFTAEGKPSDFSYVIEKIVFDGKFDPSIGYFSSGKSSFDNLTFKSTTGPQSVSAQVEKITSDMTATKRADGRVDLVGGFDARAFGELMNDPTTGQVNLSADSMNGSVDMKGFGATAFRDLVVFGLDLVKAKPDTLTPDQDQKLKALIKANMPFVEDLSERIVLNNLKVSAQGVDASFAEAGYSFGFNGIRTDSAVRFGFHAKSPTIPAGLLPPGTEKAVPTYSSFDFALNGLNLEGVLDYLATHADFTKKEPLTPQQSDEIGKIVLPDGKLHMAFSNVNLRSEVYDFSMEGGMTVNPDNSDKAEADVTITARDFDKTIDFMQKNAGTVPEFGQGAFMALAMKGFGKAQADGSMVWNVKVDMNGDVTINGQPMKM